eukprot:scaffold22489_cov62-Phaeocystis_antarctica.AAC.3
MARAWRVHGACMVRAWILGLARRGSPCDREEAVQCRRAVQALRMHKRASPWLKTVPESEPSVPPPSAAPPPP